MDKFKRLVRVSDSIKLRDSNAGFLDEMTDIPEDLRVALKTLPDIDVLDVDSVADEGYVKFYTSAKKSKINSALKGTAASIDSYDEDEEVWKVVWMLSDVIAEHLPDNPESDLTKALESIGEVGWKVSDDGSCVWCTKSRNETTWEHVQEIAPKLLELLGPNYSDVDPGHFGDDYEIIFNYV